MRQLAIPLSAAIVVVLAACQAAPAQTTPAAPPEVATPQLSDTERGAASVAIDALAAELKIPKDGIVVESVRAVDWRDSSLGCPKPGMAYMQVITPGHEVTLRAAGGVHVVHEADNKAFVCRQAKSVVGAATAGTDLTYRKQLLQARKDLATRLYAPEADIGMVRVSPTTWVDASLGCPEPGTQYAQVETDGWLFVLRHGAREYTYHADAQRVIPCPPIAAE